MRDITPPSDLRPLLWLLGALVGAYVAQHLVAFSFPGVLGNWIELRPGSLLAGRVWTLLTYSFVHDPITSRSFGVMHLVGNALVIFSFGRSLVNVLGARVFFNVYFGAVLAGGLLWFAINHTGQHALIGASAGAMGLLTVFCLMFPNDRITLLLFWILPVTVQPKYLLLLLGGLTFLLTLFAELIPVAPDTVAHSAHLGGMLAGIIAYRYLRLPGRALADLQGGAELPGWFPRRKRAVRAPEFSSRVDLAAPADLRAEVDRILDKINTSGFGSLTPAEKRTLDSARNTLNRR